MKYYKIVGPKDYKDLKRKRWRNGNFSRNKLLIIHNKDKSIKV